MVSSDGPNRTWLSVWMVGLSRSDTILDFHIPFAIRRLSGRNLAEIKRIRASCAAHICRALALCTFCFSCRRAR